MKKLCLILMLIVFTGLVPVLSSPAQATKTHQFTTIDVPGSVATLALQTAPGGGVIGYYIDDMGFAFHGFLRAPDGTITTFDAPGAGTSYPLGTFAESINTAGAITGFYQDGSSVYHGYLRAPGGTLTSFDAPGAGTGGGQGTFTAWVTGMNQAGAIAGYALDASGVYHGYLRAPDGTITTFDVPGAGTGGYPQGTTSSNINPAGAIAGLVVDASTVNHGFVRAPDGTITTFDAPGAGTASGQGTIPVCNNPVGAITGWFIDASGVYHGFLRN